MEDPPAGLDLSESQVPRILGVNIATLILAILAVALRFISRRVSNAKFWWDDWLTLPALVSVSSSSYFDAWLNASIGSRVGDVSRVDYLQ